MQLNKQKISPNLFKIEPKTSEFLVKNKRLNKSLYTKVLGSITKKGKLYKAKEALNYSMFVSSKLCKIPHYRLLTKVLKRVKCYAHIHTVVDKKRKRTTLIPFPTNKARQRFLKINWFLHGARYNNTDYISFGQKLRVEFARNIEKPSYLKTQRTELNKTIKENIANAHFRWIRYPNKKIK